MPCQDPVTHSEHFLQESADEVERDQAFRRTLNAALDDGEEQERLAKRREEKARFWLSKMASGEQIDWGQIVPRMRVHDPRSAAFLKKLVAHARKNGLLD
jgi:hypothetical protein